MALFTAIATTLFAGTFLAGTIAVPLLAGTLALGASVGLSYAMQALAGKPKPTSVQQDSFSVQTTVNAAGVVPRSFIIGYAATAGSRVYANQWGIDGKTPNAYFTDVLALCDLPGCQLIRVWVNNEPCTLDPAPHAEFGNPVIEYRRDGRDHLWIKFYNGHQTAADPFLVSRVSSAERPYASTRVGDGVCYGIVTALVNEKLFPGVPAILWELRGIPLYDASRDSTNGGAGAQRYSDASTWGGDGDQLPAVQAYNIARGLYYKGEWFYGFQRMTAARLPALNWIAQIAKCRAVVDGEDGPEPAYRSGGEISVSAEIGNTLQTLLTTCQGRLSEIGGFYKIRLGSPDAPVATITDDVILSSETAQLDPFFGLADSVNGIQGSFPDPDQSWARITAPPLFDADAEERDGGRRLLANPSFDFVPYPAQVQRLQKSALLEARRERRHAISLPAEYWVYEPGDIIAWTSVENGYDGKLFRIDAGTDKYNLDNVVSITEVDPADYDYDHASEFVPVNRGSTQLQRPVPQDIIDWFVEPYVLVEPTGLVRRPAIRMSWDPDQPGVIGVSFQIRLKEDQSIVYANRTDFLDAGAVVVSQNLLPDTEYQAQGQYIPSSPRDVLPSDWIDVTTPDLRLGLHDFNDEVQFQVTQLIDGLKEEFNERVSQLEALVGNQDSRNWLDKQKVRSQLASRTGAAFASIEEVRTVATDTQVAFAEFTTTITAQFGDLTAEVATYAVAIATLEGYAAAKYGVQLTVDGVATGFELFNGGAGFTSFTIRADKIAFQLPGYNGGAPVSFLTTGTVNGVPAIGMRGNFYLDGTLNVLAIEAGSIGTRELMVNGVTLEKIVAGAATKINSASLASPVTLPAAYTLGASPASFTHIDNETVLLSSSFFCAGGTTLLLFSVTFEDLELNKLIIVGGTPFFYSISHATSTLIKIYIDGILTRTYQLSNTLGTTAAAEQYPMKRGASFTPAVPASLSAGMHSVQIRARSISYPGAATPGGGTPTGPVFSVADFISFESRR